MKNLFSFAWTALIFSTTTALGATDPAVLETAFFAPAAKKKICKEENNLNRVSRSAALEGLLSLHGYSFTSLPHEYISDADDLVQIVVDPCKFYDDNVRRIRPDDFAAPMDDTGDKIPDSEETPLNFCRQYRHTINAQNTLLRTLTENSSAAGGALIDYVDDVKRSRDKHYRVIGVANVERTLDRNSPNYETDRPGAYLKALLDESAAPSLTIACLKDEKEKDSVPYLIVRSKPTELPILKKDLKTAKSAEISFTNNAEKGERTIDLRGVVGFQTASRPQKPENATPEQMREYQRRAARFDLTEFSRIPYLQFTYSTVDSDDDAKDKSVRELTPGFQLARNFGVGTLDPELKTFCNPLCWRMSGDVAYTFDLAQDARVLRARGQAELLALRIGGKAVFDGTDRIPIHGARWSILYHPKIAAITEVGHVFEAGTSEDFMTLEDDQYVGFGGMAGLSLRPLVQNESLAALNRFTLSAAYRRLSILSGTLEDQTQFLAEIDYKITDNVSLKASYLEGQNLNTFQDEELTKIGLGFKY